MIRPLIFALVLLTAFNADAINKCVSTNGQVVYTDSPCGPRAHGSEVEIRASRPSARPQAPAGDESAGPANAQVHGMTATEGNRRQQAWIEQREREDKRAHLNHQIREKQDDIDTARSKMQAELDRLRDQKRYSANNLAGAQWETSISGEMQAVTDRYNAQIEQDQRDVETMRKQVDQLDKPDQ